MCFEEQVWCLAAIASAVSGAVSTYFLGSPIPLLAAFAFCAITVARMEDEAIDEIA